VTTVTHVPDVPLPTRSVTIVVTDDGELRGQSAPFEVSTPWWNDIAEISDRHPGLAVLRLLDGRPDGRPTFSGSVRYVAEWLPEATVEDQRRLGPLEHTDARLLDDPLRAPWAAFGGPASDLAWASTMVDVVGRPRQHRTWNLSAIWELPTPTGRAWLKCVPSFMAHESAVLGLLASGRVPRVLGTHGHRQLLADMPGRDGYDATTEEYGGLIDLLVSMQSTTIGRDEELLSLGVTDRRWSVLVAAARSVVERVGLADPAIDELFEGAAERIARIEECLLPDVLVHGDAHPGNARIGQDAGEGYWFDWGDSRLGNPMIDLAVLERPGVTDADVLRSRWTDAWRSVCPASNPTKAWSLAKPLAALGDAVVYQGFLDRIELTERAYHLDDVPQCLARAARLATVE
jgi:Phosphotransferase enzyme family